MRHEKAYFCCSRALLRIIITFNLIKSSGFGSLDDRRAPVITAAPRFQWKRFASEISENELARNGGGESTNARRRSLPRRRTRLIDSRRFRDTRSECVWTPGGPKWARGPRGKATLAVFAFTYGLISTLCRNLTIKISKHIIFEHRSSPGTETHKITLFCRIKKNRNRLRRISSSFFIFSSPLLIPHSVSMQMRIHMYEWPRNGTCARGARRAAREIVPKNVEYE